MREKGDRNILIGIKANKECNALERSFREVKQKVRGTGRFEDEKIVLRMVYS
jgi:hypothetical protein